MYVEHSAELLNYIKLPYAFKTFVTGMSIFEWPLKTGFAVVLNFGLRLNLCHILCTRAELALANLGICVVSPEPVLLNNHVLIRIVIYKSQIYFDFVK